MTFPARYPGECVECGARIHVGDPITRADDDEGWVHAAATRALLHDLAREAATA